MASDFFHTSEHPAGFALVETTALGLSEDAATLYRSMFEQGDGNMRRDAEGRVWMDVYLDNARAEFPATGKRLAGLFSALEGKNLYCPTDGYAWGEIQVVAL